MEYAFLVNGGTKRDMFCALGNLMLHYALVRDFVINPNKCYSRGFVHIPKLVALVVGPVYMTYM